MALLLPLFAFAAYLWSIGRSVVKGQAFPPPGVRMVRKTEMLTGDVAVRRGRLLEAFALFLALAAMVLGGLLWRLDVLLQVRLPSS